MTLPGNIIETPRGELDQIVGPDGNLIKLGLLPPVDPPRLFADFTQAMGVLNDSQIRELIDSGDRTSARERWDSTWIKDQDGRGACQGYGSASAVERIRDLRGLARVDLSGDAAYALVNGGWDRGSALSRGMSACQSTGYPPSSLVPQWEYRKNRIPQKAWDEASRFKALECYRATTEMELYTGLALGFVAVIAVHVGGSFSRLDKYGISRGGNGRGNHAVCCDDLIYDKKIGGYKVDVPNSWKTSWGDNGRGYFTFDRHLRTTIRTHSFYLLRGAVDDEDADNPPAIKGGAK